MTDLGPDSPDPRAGRRLAEPPSARFARSAGDAGGQGGAPGDGSTAGRSAGGAPTGGVSAGSGSALAGPLARATLIAIAGAAALVLVGAILASTFGLLFVAGITGGLVGLTLSRAAAPLDEALRPVPRRSLAWLGIALALAAVAIAAVITWLIARAEGGTLQLLDYLLTTFGPFVPAEAVLAAVAAWWGASSGPVRR